MNDRDADGVKQFCQRKEAAAATARSAEWNNPATVTRCGAMVVFIVGMDLSAALMILPRTDKSFKRRVN